MLDNRPELKASLKRIGWTALAIGAFMVVIAAVDYKKSTRVQRMDIVVHPLGKNAWLIDEEDIRGAIDLSFEYPLEGLPVGQLDVKRVERVLEEDPFILDADVYLTANNVLEIGVIQRQPVLRIIDRNGLSYYLDREGNKMPLSENFTARVLVASGNIPPHVPDFLEREQHTLHDLFRMSADIRRDELLHPLIDQVYVSSKGEFILLPKVGDHKINFGEYVDVDRKWRNLRIFYQEIIPQEGWQRFKSVNLKYDGQIVCR